LFRSFFPSRLDLRVPTPEAPIPPPISLVHVFDSHNHLIAHVTQSLILTHFISIGPQVDFFLFHVRFWFWFLFFCWRGVSKDANNSPLDDPFAWFLSSSQFLAALLIPVFLPDLRNFRFELAAVLALTKVYCGPRPRIIFVVFFGVGGFSSLLSPPRLV